MAAQDKKYIFHGSTVMAHRLYENEKDGVDYLMDPRGALYLYGKTTYRNEGRAYFEPGDWLVTYNDGTVVIRKPHEFLPHAKEVVDVPPVPAKASTAKVQREKRRAAPGGVHRKGKAKRVPGGVRMADDGAETLGKAGKRGGRGPAQQGR